MVMTTPPITRTPRDIPADCWLTPGTRTFAVFFPDLAWRYDTRTMDAATVRRLADRQLRLVVGKHVRRYESTDASALDDAVQELKLRVAQMDAASRYDPARASPSTYLSGIARRVVHEMHGRRQPPRMASLDRLPERAGGGDPALIAERNELLARLERLSADLTPGEMRALVQAYGPVLGKHCPVGRARRPVDPTALDRAIEILQTLESRQ